MCGLRTPGKAAGGGSAGDGEGGSRKQNCALAAGSACRCTMLPPAPCCPPAACCSPASQLPVAGGRTSPVSCDQRPVTMYLVKGQGRDNAPIVLLDQDGQPKSRHRGHVSGYWWLRQATGCLAVGRAATYPAQAPHGADRRRNRLTYETQARRRRRPGR